MSVCCTIAILGQAVHLFNIIDGNNLLIIISRNPIFVQHCMQPIEIFIVILTSNMITRPAITRNQRVEHVYTCKWINNAAHVT